MSKSEDVYPKVVSYISGNALWLEWEPISGAEGYAIGLKRGKSWTLLKQLPASCTEVSVPKVPSGTYELAVAVGSIIKVYNRIFDKITSRKEE